MKKFIAPLIFGILVIAAVCAYLIFVGTAIRMPIALAVCGAVAAAFLAAMVVTLVRRYREIKEEKDDDLSQY